MLIVRRGVIFSLRLASCCSVEVMNGGAAVRFFLPRLILPTVNGFAGNGVHDCHRLLFVFQLGLAVRVAVVAR